MFYLMYPTVKHATMEVPTVIPFMIVLTIELEGGVLENKFDEREDGEEWQWKVTGQVWCQENVLRLPCRGYKLGIHREKIHPW